MSKEEFAKKVPFLTGLELAQAIRERKVSCVDALNTLLDRINALHGAELNAIIAFRVDEAKTRAKEADKALQRGQLWGPLHGVPMTIKETNDVAGMKTTKGDPALKDFVAPRSDYVVEKLEEAGAIIFGKTNIYGSTSNPWDTSRTPGGSSGGGVVAVSCYFTPLEFGSDVGGSIRIPAAFCGVYGHKPTYGIVPAAGPSSSRFPSEVTVRGPFARSPEDLATLLKICSGPHKSTVGLGWELKLPEPTKLSLKEFKVVIWDDDKNSPVCDELRQAAKVLGKRLENAGAQVNYTARPDFDTYHNLKMYHRICEANRVLQFGEETSRVSLFQHRLAKEEREKIRSAWFKFFENFDIVIVPSHASLAFTKDERPDAINRIIEYKYHGEKYKASYYRTIFWAYLTNVAHLPSTTFPCGVDELSGLPIGLNAVAKEYDDLISIDFVRLLREELNYDFIPPPKYTPQDFSRL